MKPNTKKHIPLVTAVKAGQAAPTCGCTDPATGRPLHPRPAYATAQ